MREQVVGDNNQIEFINPATGQILYSWDTNSSSVQDLSLREEPGDEAFVPPRVLILVKKNDEELLQVAANVSA